MSREIDRRTFAGGRLSPTRMQELRSFAVNDSARLPGEHHVSVVNFDATTGNPAMVLSEAAPAEKGNYIQRARDHVQRISTTLGLTETQPAEFVADPNIQETSSGAVAVHLQQLYKGIPIFQAAQAVRFDPDGRLQETVGQSITIPQDLAAIPRLRVQDAVLIAARHVAMPDADEQSETDQFGEPLQPSAVDLAGFAPRVIATFPEKPDQPAVLEAGPFGDEIKASLIWFDLDGDLRLAWEVILTAPGYAAQYRTLVDAEDGALLYCHQLIPHVTARGNVYRVDGGSPREMVDFPLPRAAYGLPIPADLPQTFPETWVESDAADGNCVYAHLDDAGPTVGGTRQGDVIVFDPANAQGDAQRILNIFYLNCYMHDFFYMLGFRERDGNFQRDNLGRGGIPSDAVDARAYRGPVSGTASMFTPIDGASPIMRMGLVASTNRHTALDSSVVFHEYTHGVSNRLVGGPMNVRALDAVQSQAMGEGWSDYIACTVNNSAVVGAWVVNRSGGIRSSPYTSDYPANLGDVGSGRYVRIHTIGEIWCAALIEMNRTIGAAIGAQLVVDGWRLTPANPTFIQARDAILRALDNKRTANQITEAQYIEMRHGVWRAFARFGMGVAARCDDARALSGIHADFSTPDEGEIPPAPSPEIHLEAAPNLPIPDDEPQGVTSVLSVARAGQIQRLSVSIDIQHTYVGDLRVSLVTPTNRTIELHAVSDDSSNDLVQTYASEDTPVLAALGGQQAQGDWRLHVADLVAEDVGVLRRWSLAMRVTTALAISEPAIVQENDLKLINGIGPGIERRLHGAGIRTYAQLGAMTPAELVALIGKATVSADRITKQDWIGQARAFAQQAAPAPAAAALNEAAVVGAQALAEALADRAEPVSRQHYATFTVELLLDETNEVRRTRVVHVQEGGQEVWAGWEDGRLVSFFVEHASLRRQLSQERTIEDFILAAPKYTTGDLLIEVDELLINDVFAEDRGREPGVATALRCQITFRILGRAIEVISRERTPYFVHILANMPEMNRTTILGAVQGDLQPDTQEYATTIEFAPPDVGRYQLLATVVLAGCNTPGVALGPWLRVIP